MADSLGHHHGRPDAAVNPARATAEIIAVGSELLSLHRIDTNSLFLTGRLAELGVTVHAKAVVGDNRADLTAHLRAALERAPLVITTGGLGPTDDDLTRDVAAEVLGREQHERADLLEAIAARFKRRGVPMPAINRRQARVPDGAVVLDNPNGSAPGLLFEIGDRLLILLPGPPREMQPMFEAHVAARVAASNVGLRVRRRVLKITGLSESQVEEIAFPIYSRLGTPEVITETTILASPGQIELHLSAQGAGPEPELDRVLADGVAQLSQALGTCVFSTDGRSLEEVVGHGLAARGWRIAAAESCTGGLLLGRLTDVPGSSAWVLGGVVAYDNAVKVAQLSVRHEVIEAHGAVSEAVARAMASGVRQMLSADVGVAITGIAGPTGGSAQKPVGTVAIAVAAGGMVSRTFLFPGDREMVRRFSTCAALEMVRGLVGPSAPD